MLPLLLLIRLFVPTWLPSLLSAEGEVVDREVVCSKNNEEVRRMKFKRTEERFLSHNHTG